jgi:hypothetical protein
MSPTVDRAVRVEADLHLEVAGLHASVTADGARLIVASDEPAALLAHWRDASLPRSPAPSMRAALDAVGRTLDDAGLAAHVVGRHGVLLEIGRGCASPFGATVLGSRHVRLGRMAAVLPVAASYVRHRSAARPRVRLAAAGVAIAALTVGAAVRRGRAGGRG